MRIRKTIFGRIKALPNTFIGGIAKLGGTGVNAPITTASALAVKLGINVSRIKNFHVIGDDVECHITGTYTMTGNFGATTSTDANQNITYYRDEDNLITVINNTTFSNCLNLEVLKAEGLTSFGPGGLERFSNTKITELNFPNFTNGTFGNTAMQNMHYLQNILMPNARESDTNGGTFTLRYCANLLLVDFRSMRFLGRKYVSGSVNRGILFTNSGSSSTVLKVHQDVTYVDVDGGLDVNVSYAKYTRGWTVELYDDNGNYVSTL